MVKVELLPGVTHYFDGYVKETLDDLKGFVKRNWDGIGFFTGYEGDGKTTFALTCALYLDPKLNLDKIVFNAQQFEEAVEKADKETCIVWDEADEIGSDNWANKMIIALKRKFKRIRNKNLYIFLVTPTIFDLQKYFVVHRTRFLFEIYSQGFDRGFVNFFNRDKKRTLYIRGKKEWDMSCETPNYKARFTGLPKGFPINMDEYEEKKNKATQDINEEKPEKMKTNLWRQDSYNKLETWLFSNLGYKIKCSDAAYVFNVTEGTIKKDRQAIRKRLNIEMGDDE